jgi:hypothetical protein
VYVYEAICSYIYACVRVCACVCACVCAELYICICVCVCVCVRARGGVRVWFEGVLSVCVCVRIYVHTYMMTSYIDINILIQTYIQMNIHYRI